MKKVLFAKSTTSNEYLTNGKSYLVVSEEDNGLGFKFFDDHQELTYSTWKNSSHLNGGDWVKRQEWML